MTRLTLFIIIILQQLGAGLLYWGYVWVGGWEWLIDKQEDLEDINDKYLVCNAYLTVQYSGDSL